jgi:hypothetical protein
MSMDNSEVQSVLKRNITKAKLATILKDAQVGNTYTCTRQYTRVANTKLDRTHLSISLYHICLSHNEFPIPISAVLYCHNYANTSVLEYSLLTTLTCPIGIQRAKRIFAKRKQRTHCTSMAGNRAGNRH